MHDGVQVVKSLGMSLVSITLGVWAAEANAIGYT
jgi:hypothetical protein